jgi:hypothetical protein
MIEQGAETTASSRTPEQSTWDVIDGHQRLLAAQQVLHQLQGAADNENRFVSVRSIEDAAALLNSDHRQLSPQIEVPVVHVKRFRPKSYEEAVAFLPPHQRLLAAQDPARLRFKLQKTPSTYTNPESSVEPEIQDVGGIHYFHHCSFLGCKRKFRCVPHIPKHYTNAPPPLQYGCRCLKENGYDMAKCYCSSECYYHVARPYDLY